MNLKQKFGNIKIYLSANPVALIAAYILCEFGDALYIYSFEMMLIGGNWWTLVKCSHLRFSLAGVSQSVKRGETIVQQKGYNLIDP